MAKKKKYEDYLKELNERSKGLSYQPGVYSHTLDRNSSSFMPTLDEVNSFQKVQQYAANNKKSYAQQVAEYEESISKTNKERANLLNTGSKFGIDYANSDGGTDMFATKYNEFKRPTTKSVDQRDKNLPIYVKMAERNKTMNNGRINIPLSPEQTSLISGRPEYENINKRKIAIANETQRQQQAYDENVDQKEVEDFRDRLLRKNAILEYSKNVAKSREDKSNKGKYILPFMSGLDNAITPFRSNKFKNENGDIVSLPTYNDIRASEFREKSDSNIYKAFSDVSQSVGNMVPGIAAGTLSGGLGSAVFGVNTYTNAKNQALLEGYNSSNASAYAAVNTGLELAVGKLLGGASAVMGKSPVAKEIGAKFTSKIMSNPVLASVTADMMSEFGEEYVQEWLDPKVKAYLLDNKSLVESWDSSKFIDKQNLYAGLLGALSAGIMNTPGAVKNQININNQIDSIVQLAEQEKGTKLTTDEKKSIKSSFNNEYNKAIKNQVEIDYENVLPGLNNVQSRTLENLSLPGINKYSIQEENSNNFYEYKPSENIKIDNLRKDVVANKWNNSEQTNNYVNMLEQIISDKGVEIRLDANLKDNNGNAANGSYKNGVITINPNSNRAGEFIAIHELTHAIGTDSMRNIVNNYMKSNVEFRTAVNDLLSKSYNSTELTEEAMADVAGQLFGNQEFVNNLSQSNPSMFKKIYNEIKYLWHQFRGYKNQNQFIEDLMFKWEQAYRNNKELNQTTNESKIEMSNQADSVGDRLSIEQEKYFKNSKVRDDGGKLIPVYHGSPNDFAIFDLNKVGTATDSGEFGRGFYFTDNQDYAKEYVAGDNKNIKSVYLNIQNPYIIDSMDTLNEFNKMYLKDSNEQIKYMKEYKENYLNKLLDDSTKEIKEMGYDGVIFKAFGNFRNNEYVAFYPNQIKNIDNTNPTSNADIRYSKVENNNEIEYNKFKSSTLFNQMIQKVGSDYEGKLLVNDSNNYYLIDKDINNNYDIAKVIPINEKNKRIIKEINEVLKNDQRTKNTSSNIEQTKSRSADNNRDNSSFEREEGWIEFIDRVFKDNRSNENNDSRDFGKSIRNNKEELGNSSFSIEENNNLRDLAKTELGTTTNLNEAGYLTDDGEYLDFSGKRQGASGGQRQMDHREIADIYSDEQYDVAESKHPNMGSNTAILQDFIDRGNIRLNGTGVEIATAPTEAQYDKLYDYLEHVQRDNGEVFVDLDTETKSRENLEYSDKTSIRKIINDIKEHYNNSSNVETTATDNQGRELSKQQQEYFKDSKVRDENGKLIPVYHGTTEEINVFDKNRLGKNTGAASAGEGFFFVENKKIAEDYSRYARPQNIKDLENEYKRLEKEAQRTGNWDEYYRAYEKYEEAELSYAYNEDNQRSNAENQKEVYLNLVNPLVHDFKGESYRDESYYDLLKQAKENGNDGAIFKNTYDGYGEPGSWDNPMTNIYVAFNSNQIKNIDNTNPTSNEDIRYSKQNETWQQFLEDNFKSKGTRTNMKDLKLPATKKVKLPVASNNSSETSSDVPKMPKTMNPIEISNLTQKDADTTPNIPVRRRNKTSDGDSKFFDNILYKTDMLNTADKKAILSDDDVKYYDKVTNEEALQKAYDRLNKDGAYEANRWFRESSEKANASDVAEGWVLLKQYADRGDTQGMVEVAKKMRDIGTKAGQAVQAFNIMERMTPEGMVAYAQSELSEAYDNMVENKSKAWIDKYRSDFELKPEEVKFIMDTMQEVSQMEDGYDKRVKLAEIQKLMTDKLPAEKGRKIKSWMRISMLFNPKTQVRNVAGNAIIMPVNSFGDLFASYYDKVWSKTTGVRTTGLPNVKAIIKGMKEGAYQATNDYKKGINTKDMEGNRFEIGEGKSFSDKNLIGKSLNRVDGMLNYIMDAGDRVFSQSAFENSLQNQMILNHTNKVTQEMIDIARAESLQRTWNDNNNYTRFVLNVRKNLNKIGFKGYGLGDVLIPFAKTPANLTKAIVDYSPVGLIESAINWRKLNKAIETGQFTPKMQHEFVQGIGRATAGTMLYVLGAALAKSGVISGESDDDKDTKDFLKNTLGINSYSIKIGDKSFAYDWAQPIAAPFSIMANIEKKKNDQKTALLEGTLSSLDSASSILLEQSFLQSINEVLTNNKGIVSGLENVVLDLPARSMPTFLKQITDMTDGTQRQTYEYDQPLKTAVNKFKVKLPGLSKTLAPKVDTMGREVQKYGGKNNIFNVFLNPANVNTENISEGAKEIYDVYKATGKKEVMPKVAPYYVKDNGEKVVLDTKQVAEYQKIAGKAVEKSMNKLLKDSTYKNMTDLQKADVISDIVNYSAEIAQNEVTNIPISKKYGKAYSYSQVGDVSDYYMMTNSIDNSSSAAKRKSIVKYLTDSNLSDKQIATLYGGVYSKEQKLKNIENANIPMKEYIKFDSADIDGTFDTKTGRTKTGSQKNAVIEYVNGLNLSIPQKAFLIRSRYSTFKSYDDQIINYVNNLDISKIDKYKLIKMAQIDSYNSEIVNYVQNQSMTKHDKEELLKEMKFKIYNGKVYYK